MALSLALLVFFYPLISFTAFHACDNFGFVVVFIISSIFCWIYYIYTTYLSWIYLDILYALIHMWHEGYLLQNFTSDIFNFQNFNFLICFWDSLKSFSFLDDLLTFQGHSFLDLFLEILILWQHFYRIKQICCKCC